MSLLKARVLALALATVWIPCAHSEQTSSPDGRAEVKLRVSSPVMTQAIAQAGARVIADYGSFSLLGCAAGVADQFAAADGVEILEAGSSILLSTGPLDTSAQVPAADPQAGGSDRLLRLVQFEGPIAAGWFEALTATGVEVVTYLPNNSYLVYGDATALANLKSLAATAGFIRWEGAYLPAYKNLTRAANAPPAAQAQAQVQSLFSIQLIQDPQANPVTLQLIDARRAGPVKASYRIMHYWNLVVGLPETSLAELANRPDVLYVAPFRVPALSDEMQDMIVAGLVSGQTPPPPGYLDWLESTGFSQEQFDASGFVVDLADSGIDNGTLQPNHSGFYVRGIRPGESRIAYNRLVGSFGDTLAGCDGHGTINAHIIGGYSNVGGFPHQDARGFQFGLGVAPFVRIGSSVIFAPLYTFPVFPDLTSVAYQSGARINSNSWGSVLDYLYTSDSQVFDLLVRDAQPEGATIPQPGNQEMVIVFSAGNDGPAPSSITPPGNAKNIITVGAAENIRPIAGLDGCSVGDNQADDANEIAQFQSRGPTADGRQKPDIVAPGTHVSGGVIQQAAPGPLGLADVCFDASGVCGGLRPNPFFPAGQQMYTLSSGTSHSCPAVAGGAALIRQFFLNQGWNAPSPAMTKALLMNSARYLTGISANDTLPSPNQGMGEMDLQQAFERGTTVPTVLRDELGEDLLRSTGQTRSILGIVADPGKPLRVTLVWTDAPGSPIGAVQRNDLDLTVTVGASTYRGNVFSGPTSITGGTADRKNNVESVFLPAGFAGPVVVTVAAANINSDGVPGNADPLDQDFALVGYNIAANESPFLALAGWSLVEESCQPSNGVPDPGETVTLAVSLHNIGAADAQNVSARLDPTDRIEPLSEAVVYGPLTAHGPAATQLFRFKGAADCGRDTPLRLKLWDQSQNLDTLLLSLPGGDHVPAFSESFDSLVWPELPPGWSTSASSGSSHVWTTLSGAADSAPNFAAAQTSPVPSMSVLISPPMLIHSATAQLSFRHRYSLHNGSGAQLLVSIAGGSPQDILTLGGTFVSGAYNGVVPDFAEGWWGWTGDSGGWITTTVRLPEAVAGQEAQLEWVLGSGGQDTGAWNLDTISILDRGECCERPAVAQLTGPSVQSTRLGPVEYVARFTKAVTSFDSPQDLEILTTGDAAAGLVTITGAGAGPYEIKLSQLTGRGTITLLVKENACIDLNGNDNTASLPAPPVSVDNVPIASAVTRLDPDTTRGSTVKFKITFSEPVDPFLPDGLVVTDSILRASIGPLEGAGSEYTLAVQNIVGNGTICAQIPAGIVHDEVGNVNTPSEQVCYTIEQILSTTRFDYQLVASLSPTPASQGVLPDTLFGLKAGEMFYLELWARQENRQDSGVTCVYTDLTFEPDKLQLISQTPDSQFAEPVFLGTGDHFPGHIRELGGCTLQHLEGSGDAVGSDWFRVAWVTMMAHRIFAPGEGFVDTTVHIGLAAADAESAAYGEGTVSPDLIVYGGLDLMVTPGARMDFDQDNDVDLHDLALFGQCESGPAIPYIEGCSQADVDLDGDVDQDDFGIVQRCVTESGIAADPDCGR